MWLKPASLGYNSSETGLSICFIIPTATSSNKDIFSVGDELIRNTFFSRLDQYEAINKLKNREDV